MVPDLGVLAPDFTLLDAEGTARSLGELVAEGPLVLIFYRGHW
jgi:peroxiredoxin